MINIDITGSYHTPSWLPFESVYVPVTPCVLDGPLSFPEMVRKLSRDLPMTIATTNANHSEIVTTITDHKQHYG